MSSELILIHPYSPKGFKDKGKGSNTILNYQLRHVVAIGVEGHKGRQIHVSKLIVYVILY